jgi:hypothetical protein
MDAVVRRRRLLLRRVPPARVASAAALAATCAALAASAALASLAGCGAGQSGDRALVGESDRPHGSGHGDRGASDAGVRDGAAALPAGYRQTFTKLNASRLVSTGHAAGRWEIDVYANDAAKKALAERAKSVPPGATVVEEHYEIAEGARGPAGPIMVMEKGEKGAAPEHGDWRWTIVGASGALVKDGVIPQCAGCHDDAPMDGLFPIVEPAK